MAEQVSLRPIEQRTLRERIVERLKAFIVESGLQAGGRLPTEREMAEQLGVSRTAVREALKSLQALGLIEARPKQGMFLRQPDLEPLTHMLWSRVNGADSTLTHVWEARKVFEMNILPLVVERANEEDWRRIERSIEEMEAAIGRGELGQEADVAFHRALAHATRNPVLESFSEVVGQYFHEVQKQSLAESLEARRVAAQAHRRIYAALRKGDVEEAIRRMETHLNSCVSRGIVPPPPTFVNPVGKGRNGKSGWTRKAHQPS
jgi:GntR family transcriptional repressor for pyruvate dehydrogenase complex